MITKAIMNILEYDLHINEVLSSKDKDFLVRELINLFVGYIPPKSQKQNQKDEFEREYDEGSNACIKQINGKIS